MHKPAIIWKEEIPHETCKKLINLGEGKWGHGGIGDSDRVDYIRQSDIVWINEQWVYDLIWPYMGFANQQAEWKYDIVSAESCQVTRYTKDGFYTWHKDGLGSHNEVWNEPNNEALHGNTRKLSMAVILNSDFEGGDFELRDFDGNIPGLKEGSIIVFPSFIDHRVTPVTKGIRYSLVAWFLGPPFR